MATANAPAPISTVWRTGSRKDTVATRNSSSPANSTNTTGTSALSCQLKRRELNSRSSVCDEPADDEPADIVRSLPPTVVGTVSAKVTFAADGVGLGISVQSRQQVSHSEESEHHYCKAKNGKVSSSTSPPSASDTHVQIAGIHQPGNCGPGFFWIPTPIRAPGLVRPVRSGSDHQSQ